MSLELSNTAATDANGTKRPVILKRLLIVAAWAFVVLLFASQWYAYDVAHGFTDRFLYYLGWSFYLWGLLTPVALWLAWSYPIAGATWKRTVPLHLAASLLLTTVQLSLEASVAWFRFGEQGSPTAMLVHYLRQHTQIGLVTYCSLSAWFIFTASTIKPGSATFALPSLKRALPRLRSKTYERSFIRISCSTRFKQLRR